MAPTTTQTEHAPVDIELSALDAHLPPPSSPHAPSEPPPPLPQPPTAHQTLKLLSATFSFFVAGTNDGSIGSLLPSILSTYHLSTARISLLYLSNFSGWLLCALTNTHLPHLLTPGAIWVLGASLQLLSQCLRPWGPPFWLYALSWGISGLGQAVQDSHANSFVAGVRGTGRVGAHIWLGVVHGSYGVGCLVAPFVATAIASLARRKEDEEKWMLFYYFPLGLSVINCLLVIAAFRGEIGLCFRFGFKFPSSSSLSFWRTRPASHPTPEPEPPAENEARRNGAFTEIKQLLTLKPLYTLSLFFFLHLGVCFTAAGWVVQYLIQARHGAPSTTGYVPAGFYGGVVLGRFLLAEPTHRFGERRMLLAYSAAAFVCQLIFWLVPNLVSAAVAFAVLGGCLGPFFAAGVSVASRILPREVQSSALGLIFVTAQAGGAIFPSLIGVIAARAGVKALQPIVAGLIVLMGLAWALVPKAPEKEEERME